MGDDDNAIADYTEAIRLNPHYVYAYVNRGIEWMVKGNYDKAIADHNEAIRLNPGYAVTYVDRGFEWMNKGEYDKAMADYNEAIRLDPRFYSAYVYRGNVWRSKGEYDKAIVDYNEALRLAPKFVGAYFDRGAALFCKGDFSSAASDLEHSQSLFAGPYTAIWLYLARMRSGIDGKAELTSNAKALDGKKWPAPVIALYLGKADPRTVISQAADPDAKKLKNQSDEANFYVGEWYLLRNDKAQALSFFALVQKSHPNNLLEYTSAVSELQRLK